MKSSPFIALILAIGSGLSPAAIVASGLRDIVITTNFDGVYLDLDAGSTVAADAAGWDINPFFGGEAIATSPAFQAARTSIAVNAPILSLTAGQTVDGSLNYLTGYAGSETHVGNSVGQFASGSEGFIGFRLTTNAGAGPYFGWMRVVLANNGSSGLIRDWAYDNTGSAIPVGAVPEPSVLCPIVLGAFAFCLKRKRVLHS